MSIIQIIISISAVIIVLIAYNATKNSNQKERKTKQAQEKVQDRYSSHPISIPGDFSFEIPEEFDTEGNLIDDDEV